jgi:hypothetical protein
MAKGVHMAAILIIAGGVVGFAAALVAFFLLDASALVALAIWSGTGILALILGLWATIAPCRTRAPERAAQTAT